MVKPPALSLVVVTLSNRICTLARLSAYCETSRSNVRQAWSVGLTATCTLTPLTTTMHWPLLLLVAQRLKRRRTPVRPVVLIDVLVRVRVADDVGWRSSLELRLTPATNEPLAATFGS